MVSVRREVLYTTIVVLIAFFSVGYASCTKTDVATTVDKCSTVVCQNGGSCFQGICSCPIGYEGDLCETVSSSRFVGTWDWEEIVEISTDASLIGTKRTYRINITQTDKLAYVLNVNDFRGNNNFDDMTWRLGWKYDVDDDGVAIQTFAAPTQFLFVRKQVLKGSRITIEEGAGSVNSIGTTMSGVYVITEPDSTGKVYKETCTFTASIVL